MPHTISAHGATAATTGEDADEVQVIIENVGCDIRRRLPYSYGASGDAQMFAIKFNLLAGHSYAEARNLRDGAKVRHTRHHAA